MTSTHNQAEHVVVMERREVIGDFTWLDARQAGVYTCFSAATIRKACRHHELQHIRVGCTSGPILTRTEWVDAWMMRGAQEPVVG